MAEDKKFNVEAYLAQQAAEVAKRGQHSTPQTFHDTQATVDKVTHARTGVVKPSGMPTGWSTSGSAGRKPGQ